jgi:hypothetical protein
MYLFGTKVTPLSFARTTTPPCCDFVGEPSAYATQVAAHATIAARLIRYLTRLKE